MRNYFASILSIFVLISVLNSKAIAQSELSCIVLDKIEDGTMQRKLDYKVSISGSKSLVDAQDLCKRLSGANSSIQSVTCTGTDGKGNYFVDLKMNKAESYEFYKGLCIKYGFRYIYVNGEKSDLLKQN